MGSLRYISPFLIFRLKPQSGLVHTQDLYVIAAPWLPKSDSGTKSPLPHFRHLGNEVLSKVVLLPNQLSLNYIARWVSLANCASVLPSMVYSRSGVDDRQV